MKTQIAARRKTPPNLFWIKIDIFEAEKRWALQAILSEERSDELYCADSRKNGKSQKRFEAAFLLTSFVSSPFQGFGSLVTFFWSMQKKVT
jgi:hypothetical protein